MKLIIMTNPELQDQVVSFWWENIFKILTSESLTVILCIYLCLAEGDNASQMDVGNFTGCVKSMLFLFVKKIIFKFLD